jgi:hypothetical protein
MAGDDRDSAMVHFRRAAELGHAKAKALVTPHDGVDRLASPQL